MQNTMQHFVSYRFKRPSNLFSTPIKVGTRPISSSFTLQPCHWLKRSNGKELTIEYDDPTSTCENVVINLDSCLYDANSVNEVLEAFMDFTDDLMSDK